jgi:threonine dehydratase
MIDTIRYRMVRHQIGTVRSIPSMLESLAQGIEAAAERIAPFLCPTPLVEAPALSSELGATVLMKLETVQPTGSFKIRGAFSKLTSLSPEERRAGIVAASSGNHGMAMAYAASRAAVPLTIVVPRTISPAKLAGIQRFGANLLLHGEESGEAEEEGRRRARQSGQIYVGPYNDFDVIHGQGTIGRELDAQTEQFDNIFVSVGGGGLISGVGAWLKHRRPQVRIFACSAENSAAMAASLAAGRVVRTTHTKTYADGLAGGIDADTVTFPICQEIVDRSILCDEAEIDQSLWNMLASEHLLVEGAAAITLAAYRKVADELRGQRSILLMCGANIAAPTILQAIQKQVASSGHDRP